MRIVRLLLCSALAAACYAAPAITNVTNAANFQPGIASATWIAIFGTGLANTTASWSAFTGGLLPTSLAGTQVTVNGIPAYVAFVSPTQVNVLVPDDAATGKVPVVVTNGQGASPPLLAAKQPVAPALFAYSQAGGRYAVSQAAATYELISPPRLLGSTVHTVQVSPGENIVLYATGLGGTNPAQATNQLVTSPSPVTGALTITIGGQPVIPQFAGIIQSGLYQINVAVPQLPNGDAPVNVSLGGVSASPVWLTVAGPLPPLRGQTAPPLSGCISGGVDSIAYSTAGIAFGAADDVKVNGADLCPTCGIRMPQSPEFSSRLELALRRGLNVQACYDQKGLVYTLSLAR